ncbi:hypothetical protein [Cryptosporangium minutisporangium]|uniref:hypothetical protein n=1 Tax=Cryptosporangium minutisporangium TaxID=113569 RepID=UPI0031E9B640
MAERWCVLREGTSRPRCQQPAGEPIRETHGRWFSRKSACAGPVEVAFPKIRVRGAQREVLFPKVRGREPPSEVGFPKIRVRGPGDMVFPKERVRQAQREVLFPNIHVHGPGDMVFPKERVRQAQREVLFPKKRVRGPRLGWSSRKSVCAGRGWGDLPEKACAPGPA